MSGELSPKGDCGQAWGGNEGTCSEPVDRLQTVSVMSVIAKEFALSRPVGELAINADRVLTHRHLLHAVFGPGYENADANLRVFVGQLRRKI